MCASHSLYALSGSLHNATDNVLAAVFMSKIDRLFEVVQELRRAKRPLTARELAEKIEVSQRTIYRDCATLQAMGIPIEGESGIGYMMRRGYDLPPLAFSRLEQEAIVMGLRMLGRTGDPVLLKAADAVISKLATASSISEGQGDATRYVSQAGAPSIDTSTAALVREGISAEQKMAVTYVDGQGETSSRIVWPLSLIYYPNASVMSAWCELRGDFRHFRIDRLTDVSLQNDFFVGQGESLRREWRVRESWPLTHRGAVA